MKKIISILFALCLFVQMPLTVFANEPYTTQTLLSQQSNELIGTQTAYQPVGVLSELPLVKPEDMYIAENGLMYIADSGLKAILVADAAGNLIRQIGNDILETPAGVYVDATGFIYVADYAREAVIQFDANGAVVNNYTRPDSPLFGKSAKFKPQKVAVDKRGNIYVVSEGSTNGIIQLSNDGTFLGYYGVNKADNSFLDRLRTLLFGSDSGSGLFLKNPPAPSNMALDQQGLVYSITKGTDSEIIKKLNVAGINMFASDITTDKDIKGIGVDYGGNVMTINQGGKITIYDSYGNLLFLFGGKDDGTSRLGLFQQPTALAVDGAGKLYVSDSEKAQITVFEPTDFGQKVLDGVALSKDGRYDQSQEYWQEVLRQNGNFGLAHSEMGKSYFKANDYPASLASYIEADDQAGYSNAFWEIRNVWLQENLTTVFSAGFAIFVAYTLLKWLNKKKQFMLPVQQRMETIRQHKFMRDISLVGHIFKHPIDTFYEIRKGNRGSIWSASILYIILYIEFTLMALFTAYLFGGNSDSVTLVTGITTVMLPLGLFLVMHYLVSTINEGSGTFKTVYIASAYALAPVLVLSMPIMIVSHILTYNEAFIYEFAMQIMLGWTVLLAVLMIKEVQDYSVGETIKNIFITIFAMVIAVLIAFVAYMLLDQVWEFIYSIIQEVMLRV